MRTRKHLILVALLFLLVTSLLFAGCGSGATTTEKTSPTTPQTQPQTQPLIPASTTPPPVVTPAPAPAPAPTPQASEPSVVLTRTGEKYHTATCRYVTGKTDTRTVPLSQAKAEGYTPCSVCDPPQ